MAVNLDKPLKPVKPEKSASPDDNGNGQRATGMKREHPRDIDLDRCVRVATKWGVAPENMRPCIAYLDEAGWEHPETGLHVLGLEMDYHRIRDPEKRRRLLQDYNSRNIPPAKVADVERHARRSPKPTDMTYGCTQLKVFCMGSGCPFQKQKKEWMQARMDPTSLVNAGVYRELTPAQFRELVAIYDVVRNQRNLSYHAPIHVSYQKLSEAGGVTPGHARGVLESLAALGLIETVVFPEQGNGRVDATTIKLPKRAPIQREIRETKQRISEERAKRAEQEAAEAGEEQEGEGGPL